jgi:hypothetical protein
MLVLRVLVLSCGLLISAPLLTLAFARPADDVERLVLIDGRSLDGWEAEEATLTPIVVEGTPALAFRVVVNWHEGEARYPIGWPRIGKSVPEGQGDWSAWEQMRLRVRAEASVDALPYQPLGVSLSTGGGNANWEREAEGLRKDQWMEFTFDLSDVPQRERVDHVGLFISEADYPDGAELQFGIADLELVRYRRPTLVGLEPLARVAFADAKALPLAVKMYGLSAGATAPVQIMLRQGQRVVTEDRLQAQEGSTQLSLSLPAGLAPGGYSLVVSGGGREFSEAIKLAASPWKEGRR